MLTYVYKALFSSQVCTVFVFVQALVPCTLALQKLTFLTQRPPARQSSFSGGQGQTGRGDPKDWSLVLEEQLGANQTTNDDVFKFMEVSLLGVSTYRSVCDVYLWLLTKKVDNIVCFFLVAFGQES